MSLEFPFHNPPLASPDPKSHLLDLNLAHDALAVLPEVLRAREDMISRDAAIVNLAQYAYRAHDAESEACNLHFLANS